MEELLSQAKVERLVLEALCLEEYRLDSTESIAALVRVAAGFRCPCPERTLVDEVANALDLLCPHLDRDRIASVVRTLVSYGDLMEAEAREGDHDNPRTQLYARPPTFVERAGGDVLVLGVGELDSLPLPSSLQSRLVRRGHTRRVAGRDVVSRLREAGFVLLPSAAWGWSPPTTTPEAHVSHYDSLLNIAPDARDVPEIRILDSERPVDYYTGRWTAAGSKSGRYVARRPRLYGNELWCYVLLEHGVARKVIDLVGTEKEGSCDLAWRLQAAIDAKLGSPQHFAVGGMGGSESVVLSVFSPPPVWAQRRWDGLGSPVDIRGTFLSYELPMTDGEDEARFAQETLWLRQVEIGEVNERMGG